MSNSPPVPEALRGGAADPPRVLLTATLSWSIAARLAMAFADLGCRVDVWCPTRNPAAHTHAVRRLHRQSGWRPLDSLRAAIDAASPDLVIPCDDAAAVLLYRLHLRTGVAAAPASALQALLARSLGMPGASALATSRGRLMALAADAGVRVPDSSVVRTAQELDLWLRHRSLPAVVKIDNSWGGQGVAIVATREQALRTFGLLAARPRVTTALTRALLDRDLSVLRDALDDTPRTVSVQAYIRGTPANRAVACWQGVVLAGISVEALRTQHATGPATVVRVIDNAEMDEAVRRLVRRLGVSGLWGADFMLEAATGAAHLIEMNPRATPICHLPLGARSDLPAALLARWTGVVRARTTATIDDDVIAMFPGEWHRDARSTHLLSHHHDVPWDEPDLVRDCMLRPWSERGVMARLWRRWRLWAGRRQLRNSSRIPAPRATDRGPDAAALHKAP